jgi:hypothetical protein
VGLWLLLVAGFGQALAAAFDINQPIHGLADLLGACGLPLAAMFISVSLASGQAPLPRGKALLWLANLTWVTTAATIAGVVLLYLTYVHAGGHVPADGRPLPVGTVLPSGAIAIVGYANRSYVVVCCLWAIIAATIAMELAKRADER